MNDEMIKEISEEIVNKSRRDTRTGCLACIISGLLVISIIVIYILEIINFNNHYRVVEHCHSCKIVYDIDTKVMYTYSYSLLLGSSNMDPILNADGTPRLYEGE